MPSINPITRRAVLSLAVVLIAAAFTRLSAPGIIEFLHDEAMLSLMAVDMLETGEVPMTGIPSSVGVPNPPISVYILALPYALSTSPQFATLFIAALNIAGVVLLWFIAYRYLGAAIAFIAGLAYALNPWAILYSRKIWAQDFHTPFFLLAILFGLLGFREGKRWAQFAFFPVLMIALQIHFAAWVLLPLVFWFLWTGRRRISWIALLAGILAAALTLIPFLIGLSQTLDEDPNRISNALNRSSGGALTLSSDALTYTAGLTTGLGLETWVAPQQQRELLGAVPRPASLWLILGASALLGINTLIFRKSWRPYAPLILLWVLLPILIFTPAWTQIYPHYFIASIPALCLLIGAGLGFLVDKLPHPAIRGLILLPIVGLFLTQAVWWNSLLTYLDTHHTHAGFGTPIHYLFAVRDSVANADDVLVISDGFDTRYDQEAAAWPVMLRGSADCVRVVTGDGLAVFPAHPFSVIVAPNAPADPVNDLYTRPDAQVFPRRPEGGVYTVAHFDSAPVWNGLPLTPITPARFSSGIQLIAYALEQNQMTLVWNLPGAVREDYHYFGHFLDSSGERIGQRDNILWPGRFWCAGDRLVSWVNIDLPAGTTTLRVGLYTQRGDQYTNASVIDDNGNPTSGWVDIPLAQAQ